MHGRPTDRREPHLVEAEDNGTVVPTYYTTKGMLVPKPTVFTTKFTSPLHITFFYDVITNNDDLGLYPPTVLNSFYDRTVNVLL